jgi:hypothetical protein
VDDKLIEVRGGTKRGPDQEMKRLHEVEDD